VTPLLAKPVDEVVWTLVLRPEPSCKLSHILYRLNALLISELLETRRLPERSAVPVSGLHDSRMVLWIMHLYDIDAHNSGAARFIIAA
jgi:hypothetical protein